MRTMDKHLGLTTGLALLALTLAHVCLGAEPGVVPAAARVESQPAQRPGPPAAPLLIAAEETSRGLQVEESNGISYLSGGVGEEKEEIERMGGFNLKLTAAAPGGKFSVPSAIRLEKLDGATVLETAPRGPIFLAKLPAGAYKLAVTTDGVTKASKVEVPQKGQVSLTASSLSE